MEEDMASETWTMPTPAIGDIVLFSTDIHTFSNPTIGFVIQHPGDSTVRILTFTPHGWVDRPSVHHKDDPAIHGDHGWADLGVWDFAPITTAVYKAAAAAAKEKVNSVASK
jgi:hypothetical protein